MLSIFQSKVPAATTFTLYFCIHSASLTRIKLNRTFIFDKELVNLIIYQCARYYMAVNIIPPTQIHTHTHIQFIPIQWLLSNIIAACNIFKGYLGIV